MTKIKPILVSILITFILCIGLFLYLNRETGIVTIKNKSQYDIHQVYIEYYNFDKKSSLGTIGKNTTYKYKMDNSNAGFALVLHYVINNQNKEITIDGYAGYEKKNYKVIIKE